MTSIPVGTCRISHHNLKRSYHKKKKKIFHIFFIAYLKCALNLEHFEKEDEDLSLVISKIIDCERSGYLNI